MSAVADAVCEWIFWDIEKINETSAVADLDIFIISQFNRKLKMSAIAGLISFTQKGW